ncbi:multicopper oxidase domain-containing protein [Oleiagrimonas sp. MCCC 1A03011]|uniref:multicopper oxidase domain-containing protein n=1 Tax=Oleiagrimonas sp. MCCC 1A03011 TaxID=1926883 RepID=UPI00143CE01A|nr:multicopper oxidase domain-containing protein [Oleiagrimonas sp. MCCC 1A03011]
MMRGTINSRHFEGTQVTDDEIVRLGSVEVWKFENRRMLPHPMRVHGLQFLVLERHAIIGATGWSGLQDGHVDEGWHDTGWSYLGSGYASCSTSAITTACICITATTWSTKTAA